MELNDSPVPDDVDVEQQSGVPKHLEQVIRPRTVKQKRGKRKLLIVVIILIVLIGLGAGGYMFLRHKNKAPAKATQAATTQNQPAPAATTNSGISDYTAPADGLNLAFSYPSDWTASPVSGQSGKTITITSPLVSLPDASGADTTGKIVVSVRGDTSNISELASTQATAPQDSIQYAYKAPTAAQHQYFYVSFLHFTSPATAQGAFQEVAITGVNQLPKGTAITSSLLGEVDPLVTASFYACASAPCTGSGQTLMGVTGASWQNNKTLLQVQTLFESLKFN